MFQSSEKIDRMRIASPCPKNWEGMTGDNRTRFCDLCSLHVYNISEMTPKEVATLIATTEGRFCARLFRRSDGTVITKDCPVGLRAIRLRVSKVSVAVITAIFSICMSAFGKTSNADLRSGTSRLKISGTNVGVVPQPNHGEIAGRVVDLNGAAIPEATVTVTNQDTGKKSKVETKADGTFRLSMLAAGLYTIEIESPSFQPYSRRDLKLGASDTINEEVVLEVVGVTGVVVITDPDMTYKGSAAKSVFKEKQIRNLPF